AAADSHRIPIACGDTYTVESGDSLYEIAIRAYGSGPKFEAILEENRDRVGNLRALSIGETIGIPCLDHKRQPEPQAREADIHVPEHPVPEATRANAPETDTFKVLASPSFGRISGQELPGGGLIPQLTRAAIERAVPGAEFDLVFTAEPQAQIGQLMRDGAVNAGIPWFRPDCDASGPTSRVTRILCERFAFSEPLFEISIAVYAGNDAPAPELLTGKRLCRASGHSYALWPEVASNRAPEVQWVDSTTACFVRLIRGSADLVVAPRAEGEATIAALQISDTVREVETLAMMRSVHAIVAKDSPKTRSSLAQINAGIAQLLGSGDWFRIVVEQQSQKVALQN
ncbi:MAG: transporter substrate-binding domain-containing protein, partial [Betaproteobacteria bacterium]